MPPPRPQQPATRIRSREAPTSECTKGISAIYGPFLPSQRFGATPRDRSDPALSAIWRNATRQERCLIVIPSGAWSPTSGPPGASAALPAPPSGGAVRATARLRPTCFARPVHTCHPDFVASFLSAESRGFNLRGATSPEREHYIIES